MNSNSHESRSSGPLHESDAEGVIISCARSLREAPGDVEALKRMARAFLVQGRYGPACTAFSQVLKLDPEDPDAHVSQAISLERLGMPEQALEHYRTAIALDPELTVAHLELGRMLHQQGDYCQAERHLRTALRLQSDLLPARFHLGCALDALGRRQDARRHWETVARSDSGALGRTAEEMLQCCKMPVSRTAILEAEVFLCAFALREKLLPSRLHS